MCLSRSRMPAHQLADLRVHHRLPAADRDHGRAALIHRHQAFFERHALGDAGLVFADAPAAGAGEIAGVQRLQHQHDGKALLDHGMRRRRLSSAASVDGQDAKRIRRRRPRVWRPSAIPAAAELVLENVTGHAGQSSISGNLIVNPRVPFCCSSDTPTGPVNGK